MGRHAEGAARRISCQLVEGFFAGAQNDDKKIKNQKIILEGERESSGDFSFRKIAAALHFQFLIF